MKNNVTLLSLFTLLLLTNCNETSNSKSPNSKQNLVNVSPSTGTNNSTSSTSDDTDDTSDDSNDTSSVIDPLFYQQWHIVNTGQSGFSSAGGQAGADINFTGYDLYQGSGILVAVSDNAVEVSHEDLSANAISSMHRNYNNSFPYSGDPSPGDDDSAHGTAVTGIIQARAMNGKGGRGIASKAQFAGFKFIGAPLTTARYIDQANGVFDIFNYSYGSYSCIFSGVPSSLISQLEYGTNTLRSGRGAIYVKAAGNEYYSYLTDCYDGVDEDKIYLGNTSLEEDHSYPFYVLVGALDADGVSAFYSTPGSAVWVSAPGGDFGTTSPAVVTTDIQGCDSGYSQGDASENDFEKGSSLNSNCNYTSTMNGTSAATPMVSGVVALMLGVNPSLSWRDVKYILASTAEIRDENIGDTGHPGGNDLSGHTYLQGWRTNGAGFHFHNWYGFGAVDADSAISMAANYNSNWGSLAKIEQSSGNLSLSIPDKDSTGTSHTINFSNSLTIEAIQLELNVTHTYIGDLGIELTSPSGTKSQLMLINSGLIQENIEDSVILSNAFFMENSQGDWTLKIIDGASQDTGTLNSWKLKVFGH